MSEYVSSDIANLGEPYPTPVNRNIDFFEGEGRGTIREETKFGLIRMYNLGKMAQSDTLYLLDTQSGLPLMTTGERTSKNDNYNNQKIIYSDGID